ncbi:hypothetical protein [Enterovibrio calviensis]|uniref:hypothetical protein n=1 Tax=Enterovibrio calviensis TaxID=91359 RepID=UPI0037360E46
MNNHNHQRECVKLITAARESGTAHHKTRYILVVLRSQGIQYPSEYYHKVCPDIRAAIESVAEANRIDPFRIFSMLYALPAVTPESVRKNLGDDASDALVQAWFAVLTAAIEALEPVVFI